MSFSLLVEDTTIQAKSLQMIQHCLQGHREGGSGGIVVASQGLLYSYQLPVLYNYQTVCNIHTYSQYVMATHIQLAIGFCAQFSLIRWTLFRITAVMGDTKIFDLFRYSILSNKVSIWYDTIPISLKPAKIIQSMLTMMICWHKMQPFMCNNTWSSILKCMVLYEMLTVVAQFQFYLCRLIS